VVVFGEIRFGLKEKLKSDGDWRTRVDGNLGAAEAEVGNLTEKMKGASRDSRYLNRMGGRVAEKRSPKITRPRESGAISVM